jgi:hypothetical protein
MTNLSKISLEDSLYVLQLARETALAQNKPAQARRLEPVVEQMRSLAAPAAGVMAQPDFKTLLNLSQSAPAPAHSLSAALERNRLIGAMAQANMSEVEIARQFSMTREEVQTVIKLSEMNK